MNYHILIPARFESQRLKGKVLIDVAGKPLIQYVYERALLCEAKSVTIATDDLRVKEAAEGFGATVCMTSPHHQSGTERLSEAVDIIGLKDDEIVVNVQADEPMIFPKAVEQAATALNEQPSALVSTLCTPISNPEEVFDSDIVKAILDKHGFAIYFSRAPIPWDPSVFELKGVHFRHIGLYAYRVKALKLYQSWEVAPLEKVERLEQLRILWHGEKIYASIIDEPLPAGIDSESDLRRFRELVEAKAI